MKFKIDMDYEKKKQLKPGRYSFYVKGAIEEQSKNGNPMMIITVEIEEIPLKVYLVNTCGWKIKEFLLSLGLSENIARESIVPQEIIGHHGTCTLVVEHTNEYGDQIKISEFHKKMKVEPRAVEPRAEELNDDIPF